MEMAPLSGCPSPGQTKFEVKKGWPVGGKGLAREISAEALGWWEVLPE
jgi:hypothetical protein